MWMNTQLSGIQIHSLIFSEAEAGKSIADRYGGLHKRHALKSVSSGFNIVPGRDLAAALLRNGGVANVHTILANNSRLPPQEYRDSEESEEEIRATISNVSFYHSFVLKPDGVWVK